MGQRRSWLQTTMRRALGRVGQWTLQWPKYGDTQLLQLVGVSYIPIMMCWYVLVIFEVQTRHVFWRNLHICCCGIPPNSQIISWNFLIYNRSSSGRILLFGFFRSSEIVWFGFDMWKNSHFDPIVPAHFLPTWMPQGSAAQARAVGINGRGSKWFNNV